MLRRAGLGLSLLMSACDSGPPDTAEAREAVAVCSGEASPALLVKNALHWRFREAFERAAKVAVSPAMQEQTEGYGQRDLAEHAAGLRAAAAAVGVRACRLADELDKVANAEPSARECDALVTMIEAVAELPGEELEPLIASGCAEIAGCARACVPGLANLAAAPEEQRALALADGCAAFRPKVSEGAAGMKAFVRARFGAFADACGPQLGERAARVAALRTQTGL